jgi:hypothetical protein
MTTDSTSSAPSSLWPALPSLDDWQDTLDTVHLWTQIVGKIRLEQSPWINHSWGAALYVTTRGLTTSPIPHASGTVAIDFDFVGHTLQIRTSAGAERSFDLEPMSVATFYEKTMQALADLGIEVEIYPKPVELPDPIQPFPEDEAHSSYDADAVQRFWRALVQADRVFKTFRARFTGKVSPVHFFWGAFDLAVTRFSGRDAPTHPGGAPNCPDWIMEEAYSKELSSAGFWPGTGLGEAAFYSYAYPEPDGYAARDVQPDAAEYLEEMGEFVLPYDAVRTADDPDATLLAFLQSTYEAGADLGDWDRDALEWEPPFA